ncbi:MAG TPA: lysophospholipid acyltransferase family protein [Ignavibacteriaceae bacterium]|nr:lysophospholipid acyltransferase family protein [Ignavibacteriaceae bacterium]
MITYFKLFLIVIHTTLCSILALVFAFIERNFVVYFWISKFFSGGILFITGIKLKVEGLENIDPKATYVFVSNHASQFDITALQYGVPNRLAMIYKKELSKIPLFGWQLAAGPYVSIDRKNAESALKSIQKAKQVMKEKNVSILVFAEGTRSPDGQVQEFKRGAFRLASSVGYPIVPITIIGSSRIMPKGKLKFNKGEIIMRIDKPIPTQELKSRQDEIAMMKTIRDIIIKNFN